MTTAEDKLKKVASKETSKWVENAQWRVANENWLDKSADIALKILRNIREKDITQKDLAERLKISPQQVSKILKGQENLTLETISKIEIALGTILINIPLTQTIVKPISVIDFKPVHALTKLNLLTQQYSYKGKNQPNEIYEEEGQYIQEVA
jgi:transcriptional regulator with XRE-family HTH domain